MSLPCTSDAAAHVPSRLGAECDSGDALARPSSRAAREPSPGGALHGLVHRLKLLTSASCRRHERCPRRGQRRGVLGVSPGIRGPKTLEFPRPARGSSPPPRTRLGLISLTIFHCCYPKPVLGNGLRARGALERLQ